MLGFLIGIGSLIGLVAVLKRGRSGGCGGRRFRRYGHRSGWGGGPMFGRRALHFLFERLDTTPGQEKEIRGAVEELWDKAAEMKRERRASQEDVAQALRSEEFDEELFGNLFSRHDERLRDMQKAFADAFARIHGVLDTEQRERLARWLENRAERWGSRRHGPYRDHG